MVIRSFIFSYRQLFKSYKADVYGAGSVTDAYGYVVAGNFLRDNIL